jgi:hypothetical protein
MKKFMIFLLMAVLYIGTCQARSEALHPDNAKGKLLSWVTPTPSQSFLTPSPDAVNATVSITAFSQPMEGGIEISENDIVKFTLEGVPFGSLGNFGPTASVIWYLDGVPVATTTYFDGYSNPFTVQNLTFGTHYVYCIVNLPQGIDQVDLGNICSPTHQINVTAEAQQVGTLDIAPIDPIYENETAILNALFQPQTGETVSYFTWFVDGVEKGSTEAHLTGTDYYTSFTVANLTSGTRYVTCKAHVQNSNNNNEYEVVDVQSLTVNAVSTPDAPTYTIPESHTMNVNETWTVDPTTIAPEFEVTPDYEWYLDGVMVSTNATFTLGYLPAGIHYVYGVASYNGITAVSNTCEITVTDPNAPNLTITATEMEIEVGQTTTITPTYASEGTIPQYEWYVNGTMLSTNTSYDFTSEIVGTYDIFCVATNPNNGVTSVSNTLQIKVKPATVVPLIIEADQTITQEEAATVTVSSYEVSGIPTYQWFLDGVQVSTNDQLQLTNLSVGQHYVYCYATTDGVTSQSNTVIITVTPVSQQIGTLGIELLNSTPPQPTPPSTIVSIPEIVGSASFKATFDPYDEVETVTSYTWYVDGVEKVSTPDADYVFVVNNLSVGNHYVTCKAHVLNSQYNNEYDVTAVQDIVVTPQDQVITYPIIYVVDEQTTPEQPIINPYHTIAADSTLACESTFEFSLYTHVENYSISWFLDGYVMASEHNVDNPKTNYGVNNEAQRLTPGIHTLIAKVYIPFETEHGTIQLEFPSNEMTINVLDPIAPVLTIAPADTTITTTEYINYAPVYEYTGTETPAWEWYLDGTMVSTNETFMVNNLTVGTHYLYCTATAEGVTSVSNTSTITVYAPTLGIVTTTPDPIYPETTVFFNATYNPAEPAPEAYTWYLDGVQVQSNDLNEFYVSNLTIGTHTVYCKATYNNVTTTSNILTITVIQKPACADTLIITPNGNAIAAINQNFTYTATVASNDPNITSLVTYNYEWFLDGVSVATGNSYTYNNEFAGSHKISCTATAVPVEAVDGVDESCPVLYSDTSTIIVSENEINVHIEGNNTGCAAALVTLTAVAEFNQLFDYTYVWRLDGEALLPNNSNVTISETGQTIQFIPEILFGEDAVQDPQAHEFTVEISYGECRLIVSPIHYYTIDPMTKLELTIPPYVCGCATCGQPTVTTATAAITQGVAPDQYKWLLVTLEGDTLTYLTTENTFDIDTTTMVTLEKVGVLGIFANPSCNSDTAWQEALPVFISKPTVVISGDPLVCVTDAEIQLNAMVNNISNDTTYNYEWRLHNMTLVEGANTLDGNEFTAQGVDTSSLIVSDLTVRENPYLFTVVVSAGNCSTESAPFYLYVNDTARVVATVNYDSICAAGTITAVAHLGDYNMPNLTYQWQKKAENATEWENIDYGTEPTLEISFDETSYLRAYVYQTGSSCVGYSDSLLIKVFEPKNINSVVVLNEGDLASNICEGAQLFVKATFIDEEGNEYVEPTLYYNWKLNGMALESIHGPEFSAQAYIYDNDAVDYTYTAYVDYGVPGCEAVEVASNTVHVRRNPLVVIDGTPNVCFYGNGVDPYGQAMNNVVLTAWVDGIEDTNAVYTWYESGQLRDEHDGSANVYRENWTPTALNPYIFTVEVVNGDGCSAISEPFYVNVYNKPYVNITNETGTQICEGGEVTLRASLDNYNDPMLTYQWYENRVDEANKIPGATHEFETFNPADTTYYIVKVTHLMDFTYEHCVAFDTMMVTTAPVPSLVVVNDLNGVKTICEGRSVAFEVISIENGVGGDTNAVYTWYRNGVLIPDAHTSSYVDAPVAVDGEGTVYYYSVEIQQAASGCNSGLIALQDTILVNPNPNLVIATSPIVCAAVPGENNITLVAHAEPEPEEVSYKWFEDNVLIAETEGDTLELFRDYRTYPYNFKVELQNTYGCVSVGTATVYVNDSIIVNITSDTNVCNGGEITLTASLDDWNADMLTYQWFEDGEEIPGATTLEFSHVPDLGDHIYTLQVEQTTSGCVATTNDHLVHVHNLPVIDSITHNLPDTFVVCEGFQLEMTPILNPDSGVAGGEIYTWYVNGSVIENAVGANLSTVLTVIDGAPTQYTFGVAVQQSADGCISNVFEFDPIMVNPNPTLLLVTDPIVCADGQDNVVLHANVYPEPITGVQYRWFEDNAPLAVTTEDSLVLTKEYRSYPYNFGVEIVNEYGCSANSEAIVYVNAQPVVNVFATETAICEGGEITLTAALNDWNAEMLTFQWYDGDVLIPGATSLSYTVIPTDGLHRYSVLVNQLTSGCLATSDTIDVQVNEIPVITSVVASQYNICNGGQISVTANLVDEVEGEEFTWFRNGMLIPGATARTIYDSPATFDGNTQQYYYTATVSRPAAGCVSLTNTSDVVTVYPNPRPVITGDQHVCETDSIFLIANVDTTGMAAGALHFTWYESGQIRDNMAYGLGDNNFYAEYFYARVEPYIFTVEVSRDNVPGDNLNNGCVATSAEYKVYVYPQPVVTVTASETEICTGGEVTLTANLDDYNHDYLIYQWYEQRERIDTLANGWDAQGNVQYIYDTVAYNYMIPGATLPTYTTTLDATTTLGVLVIQTATTCTTTDAITITVNPRPVITSVIALDQEVCNGAQVVVAATTNQANDEEAVYTWYRNGIEIEGAHLPIFMENVYTNDNHVTVNYYSVMATFPASGCFTDLTDDPEAIVTINPAPTTVSITGNNVICEGDSTILSVYSDVVGEILWSNGSTEPTIKVPAGTYTVTVYTTESEACEMTSEPFVVTALGTDIIVTATSTNICEGEHTTLMVNQNGWQGNVTYQWDANANNDTASTVDVQPLQTTTYQVIATVNSTNGSCSVPAYITINVNPRPAAPNVIVPFDTICLGEQIAAILHPMTAASTYNLWYVNGVQVPGENNMTYLFTPESNGVYLITARTISDEGCVSEMSAPSALYPSTVVVVSAPQSVEITGINNFCEGGHTTLYANVTTDAPANQVTYAWFKDGAPFNSISVDHITVTEAGSYKVIVTNYGRCSTESVSYDVTVAETPQLQLTATETEICVGGTTVITAESTGWNNGDVNYYWNNGFHGSVFTHTATTAGVDTFIVTTSQSTSGCFAVDTILINVYNTPATPIVVVTNDTVCDGGQVTLTVTNPVEGADYTWMRDGYVIEGTTGSVLVDYPMAVAGDPTQYIYTVIANLPQSGCQSQASEGAIVNVLPAPVVSVTVEGNTVLCQGGSTILHAVVTPEGDYGYTYQWYKDNTLIPGATSANYTVIEPARETPYEFKVVVTAHPGCIVTAVAPAITVVADPVVTATISTDITCVGGVATLTAEINGGVDPVNGLNDYTYQWYRNTPTGLAVAVGNGATYTTEGTEAPNNYTYWVVVDNGYGCNASSNIVNYSVVADPQVTIVRVPEFDATVCDGGETAIKALVQGGYGEASYQWFINGNLIPGETNQVLYIPTLSYGVNDNYSVVVTQTGVGCSGEASANINTLVTVHPTYIVNIEGSGNVCEGGTLTLTATVPNMIPGDVLGYQWYRILNGSEAPINGANSETYTTSEFLLGNSYDYYVVVTSSFSGCYVQSSTVPANVVAAPSVAIQGANTVCEGGNLTLNAFVTGGVEGADYIYTWTWTGAGNGTAQTNVPTYVPVLPANDVATPYYFTVTISRPDNTGCSATSAAHEINVLAVPTVSVTADNAYVCQGGDVTLTAHVSPVGAYNYVWTINGQQQAVNAATVTTSMPTVGTVNATVVVSAANASASCSASASLAVPVQVVAAPSVTISADHTAMCVGGTTTLTANVTSNGNIPGEFNYQWAINGIEVEGAVASTFVQPLNAAGNYTYTLRVSQNNNLGCNSTWSAPVTVQVAEQPEVVLTSLDGLDICEGGSITMNAVVVNYNTSVNGVLNSNVYGGMNFEWIRNAVSAHQDLNVTTSTQQFTETLNTIGNYHYRVVVDPAGYNCQPQVSNIVTVGVVGNPSWTEVHVYSSNGTDACLGDIVTLNAAIQGGVTDLVNSTSGHIQWIVTDENGNTFDVSGGLGGNSYDIPAAAGTYTYTPTFVGNIGSGCQLTNTDLVSVGVTVHELPTAQFISGDGTALCANDGSASAELVISFTGVAPFVYEVVDGNGNVVAHATTLANTVSVFVSPSTQTTYRITLVQDAYCVNDALEANAVATVYVNEIQFDDNMFISGCDDNGQVTVYFNMISGNPNAAFNVTYSTVDLAASGTISNGTATFAAPSVPGDYPAVITIDGCSYDIVVRVLVGEFDFGGTLPIMDQRWNDVVVVNNNPATNGGHTFVGFQWYHNGELIPGATYSNYQDLNGLNGFYSVELIEQDANGNMVVYQTCDFYFNTTGSVKVYPVPANVRQEITIELDLTSEQLEGAILDIYSVTGAHIEHVTNLQPITKIEGFKAQGTYFGRILTGTNEIKTVKFVIVK